MKRIFIGLEEIAGYNRSLKHGFDELGVKAINVSLTKHRFQYSNSAKQDKLTEIICRIRPKTSSGFMPIMLLNHILYRVLLLLLFIKVLIKCDVFIFGFMNTFLWFYELPILKLFRKRIIYIFFGSDSRPYYINGKNMYVATNRIVKQTRRQKAAIRKIERYADIIISHPPSSQLHEKKFIPCMRMGFPFACGVIPEYSSLSKSCGVRILHAPSHVEGKGTNIIRQAITHLKGKGYAIEYVEIIDKPNDFVLDELSHCDFVIDELYSDAVMAGFATEAAFFGKPAVVGGYATLEDIGNLPVYSIPPVHHCHPDDIEIAIEKLIVDEVYRKDLGGRAKQFVNQNWSARAVAERYLRIIEEEIPEDWFHDPRDIRYLHGWGLPECKARKLVRSVIEFGGIDALQLAGKPDLAQRFYRFAFRVDA